MAREKEFEDVTLEADRVRVFNEFLVALEESCGHHHKPRKPKKQKQVRIMWEKVFFFNFFFSAHVVNTMACPLIKW